MCVRAACANATLAVATDGPEEYDSELVYVIILKMSEGFCQISFNL